MKILKPKTKERFADLTEHNQGKEDPIVIAHFYEKGRDWFATEYYPDDKLFYGYIKNTKEHQEYDGWACFYIQQLQFSQEQGGFQMDHFFIEQPISKIVPEVAQEIEIKRRLKQFEKLERIKLRKEQTKDLEQEL